MGRALLSLRTSLARNGRGTAFSIVRRRRVRDFAAPGLGLRLLHLIGQPRHLPVERLDLIPLRGQRLAEILGDSLLMGAGYFQSLDAGAQCFGFVHDLSPVSALGCDAADHIAPAAKV